MEVKGWYGRHPQMGPYLPIEVVCAPTCCMVNLWRLAHVGGGKTVLFELEQCVSW